MPRSTLDRAGEGARNDEPAAAPAVTDGAGTPSDPAQGAAQPPAEREPGHSHPQSAPGSAREDRSYARRRRTLRSLRRRRNAKNA
jgi:hypothetical protein